MYNDIFPSEPEQNGSETGAERSEKKFRSGAERSGAERSEKKFRSSITGFNKEFYKKLDKPIYTNFLVLSAFLRDNFSEKSLKFF